MTGLVAKALKSAGLVPAVGAILAHLINADFLEKIDPLQGYGGAAAHFWALGLCAIAWLAANRIYVRWPRAANVTRPISSGLAAFLFVITLILVLVSLPEDYTSLGDVRWSTALVTYFAFYLTLGVAFA
jgi:hypothetical protein